MRLRASSNFCLMEASWIALWGRSTCVCTSRKSKDYRLLSQEPWKATRNLHTALGTPSMLQVLLLLGTQTPESSALRSIWNSLHEGICS